VGTAVRICWICPNFRPPYVEGVKRMFSSALSQIGTGDVEVHVITNVSPRAAAVTRDDFIIHEVETKRVVEIYEFIPNLRFFYKAGRLFLHLHRTLRFDVVQIVGSLPILGLYVALLAKVAGCRSVWGFLGLVLRREELTALHLTLRDRPFWYRLFLSRMAFRLLARLWSHSLDGIIVGSQIALSLLRDIGVDGKKLFLIPPGVNLHVFRPRPTADRSPFRILYASTCYPWKGTLDLLEAFRLVVARGLPAELVYLFSHTRSESKTSEACIGQLERRVSTMGLRDRVIIRDGPVNEIEEVIAHADVLVCPLQSGIGTLDIPMSVLEAMACGLPVVGTRVGAVPEAIVDGVNGYLVAPRAPEALAQAITKILEAPATRRSMGKESSRLAKQFDVRRSALLLREMYCVLVEHHGAR
jgi:glycosyltransferase involved in cell wall biosynthesis